MLIGDYFSCGWVAVALVALTARSHRAILGCCNPNMSGSIHRWLSFNLIDVANMSEDGAMFYIGSEATAIGNETVVR
jgi:hypothetical protein